MNEFGKCCYFVKARTAVVNSESGELEFKAVEKKFEDINPIIARENAFKFRNEFLYGILTDIGLDDKEIGWNFSERRIERLTDRDIRRYISPYLEVEVENSVTIFRRENEKDEVLREWEAPNDSLSWYTEYNNGIWVIFRIINDIYLENDIYFEDFVIDKVTRFEEPLPTPPIYTYLETKLEFYKKYGYETKHYETTVNFFDDEKFLDDNLISTKEDGNFISAEEAEIEASKDAMVEANILKTPFDWSGYETKYWWLKEDDKLKVLKDFPIPMKLAFERGEDNKTEFKPILINPPFSQRNFELENMRTICAFLNSNGGYLFIGVSDKGDILGIDFNRYSKDEFLLEFSRIKRMYLKTSIAESIHGEFYTKGEKEVFVVTLFPDKILPVLLKRKADDGKTINELYVRSDAASRHLYNLEDAIDYCLRKWNSE